MAGVDPNSGVYGIKRRWQEGCGVLLDIKHVFQMSISLTFHFAVQSFPVPHYAASFLLYSILDPG
jgi:hypothetical protein